MIIVALTVMVLLGAVALAVDGGHLYSVRRQMQNAADAGALAGARVLCTGGTVAQAEERATYYAEHMNGADKASPVVSGGTVTVTAETLATTFLAGVLGTNDANVSAVAVAACECANEACALWPIAFDKNTWDAEVAAGSCVAEVLLWDDKKVDCTMYDCSAYAAVPPDSRTWIDFSAALPDGETDPCDQSGCGNDELRDRVKGYEKKSLAPCFSWISLPACVPGDSGTKTDSWKAAEEEVGKIKRIPLYSSKGCTMGHDPGNACSSDRFYITAFACIKVVRVQEVTFQPLPEPPGHKPPPNWPKNPDKVRVIVAKMVCEGDPDYGQCFSGCGRAGPIDYAGCVKAVSLIR